MENKGKRIVSFSGGKTVDEVSKKTVEKRMNNTEYLIKLIKEGDSDKLSDFLYEDFELTTRLLQKLINSTPLAFVGQGKAGIIDKLIQKETPLHNKVEEAIEFFKGMRAFEIPVYDLPQFTTIRQAFINMQEEIERLRAIMKEEMPSNEHLPLIPYGKLYYIYKNGVDKLDKVREYVKKWVTSNCVHSDANILAKEILDILGDEVK